MTRALIAFLAIGLIGTLVWSRAIAWMPQASSGGSVVGMLILGFVASVSTCLASTGAYFLTASTRVSGNRAIHLMHLGRFLAFMAGGALLGALGAALPESPWIYGAFGMLLGIGFLGIGLQLLDLAPAKGAFGWLPGGASRRVEAFMGRVESRSPWVIGAISFILPCGFTQTAQAFALGSGSAWTGAVLLGAFAVGTAPVLYTITRVGGTATGERPWMRLATGAVLAWTGLTQLDGGLTVLGSPITLAGMGRQIVASVGTTMIPTVQAQEQLISMRVIYGTFSPNRFVVRRNVPVRWQIEGVDVTGCANTLVSPRLGIQQSLIKGANEIVFTPKDAGDVPFSCAMGMIRGSFTVVD